MRWSIFLKTRPLALGLAACALLLGSALAAGFAVRQAQQGAHAAAGGVPAGMPTHFSFGAMDAPGDTPYLNGMRANNGTAWDFRYQYLAGGVNTGHGWTTWNSPAGAFATYYMNDSASNGYIPAFVYYLLQQSNGPSGGGGAGDELAHLDSPSTMNAYYADWTLLMRKIGAFGKPTLVIVEPDLWGFMEQAALARGSNSARIIPASVASSGNADAAGLPDNAQGFTWALLKIRDHYAHNAILALHASPWGTGKDIASDSDPHLDAAAVGTQAAQFLNTAGLVGNPSGISTFDLISSDIADHDSGQSGIWWDRYNKTYPNFTRYLQFAHALSTATARRIVMWQVPEGNQYFDTENNSSGHTQDNKAEYILGHIADFAKAGVIGVLFGPGNGGTYVQDAQHDGVTNPAPISTYECNGCNNHTSSYADDDGGYLRIVLGQYYKSGGYQLGSSGGNFTPTLSSTTAPSSSCTPTIAFDAGSASPLSVTPGASVKVATTFTASCASSGLVDFEVYNSAGQKVWQTFQDNQSLTGSAQSFSATWNVPAGAVGGAYSFKVGVFSPGWGTLYGWDNNAASIRVQSSSSGGCTGNPAITFNSSSASPSNPAPGSSTVLKVTLTASCASSGLVDFEVYNSAGQKVWQSYLDNQTLTGSAQSFSQNWAIPKSQAADTYTFKVGIFSAGWGALYGWNNNAASVTIQ